MRVCDLRRDLQYDVSTFGRGYEKRAAEMELTDEGIPEITGYRTETVLMNSILPTSGTFMRGREQQGYLDLLSMAGGLYQFYEENSEYHDLKDRYDRLNSYLQSSGSIDQAEQLRKEAHRAYIYAEQQNTYRKQLFALTSALYAFQVLEPLFIDNPPPYRRDQGSSHIVFSGRRKSTGKAFLYSLVRPGRGQYYQGKNIRGLFYSAVSVLAGYVALDQNNQYQKKLDDYNITLEEYNYARTISERSEYIRTASILREDAEDARDNRDLSLYILAGIWGANLIDTLLFECRGVQCGYSFNVTPGGFELAYRF
ncbi:MAG: DUF5683 domain-containing protein [Candidatus Krumholzibacteriales bacterium]